jgi:hypothetical protein
MRTKRKVLLDAVRAVNPGFAGPWPRIQLWHGTNDPVVPYSRLNESIEQWTNVHGLSQTPTSTDIPQSGWSRRRYADSSGNVQVEAYTIQGAGHTLPSSGMAAFAIAFFGLSTPGQTTPPSGPTSPVQTTPPASGSCRVSATVNAWNTGLTEDIITSGWNASYSPTSGQVTARNLSYNATIAPNASLSIGFQATHSGNTAKPTSFTLDGAACAVA